MLTRNDVNDFITNNHLDRSVICLHSSMKSFGESESGPQTIIEPLLARDATIIVPAFYYQAEANPIRNNYRRNGIDYSTRNFNNPVNYTGSLEMIEVSMGIIPRTILSCPDTIRSQHPMGSFAGIGPHAPEIINTQTLLNIYGPYKRIYADFDNTYILMAGTNLTSCTPVHYAEEKAGRTLFRRWAVMNNRVCEIQVGGCSEGFNNLLPLTASIQKVSFLGPSKIMIYRFKPFIDLVAEIIMKDPEITRCSNPGCIRCDDIINGGPLLK